jgi:hypothetical protein
MLLAEKACNGFWRGQLLARPASGAAAIARAITAASAASFAPDSALSTIIAPIVTEVPLADWL